jgi:arginase family enzyme
MFYSPQILNKKGPLGIIWIAAHFDKNLKRSQVWIGVSVSCPTTAAVAFEHFKCTSSSSMSSLALT